MVVWPEYTDHFRNSRRNIPVTFNDNRFYQAPNKPFNMDWIFRWAGNCFIDDDSISLCGSERWLLSFGSCFSTAVVGNHTVRIGNPGRLRCKQANMESDSGSKILFGR